jgi:AcrR family transcriptional regulator
MPRPPRARHPRPRRREVRAAVRAVRRRRSPEDARRELLDAAEHLFARVHPDAVGLVHVARAAGVSHALVTHYFGTYAGLVDAVLERRQDALREQVIARLREHGAGRPDELLAMLFESLDDPVSIRLWLWTLATERPAAADFFPLRSQGLRAVATAVAAAVAAQRGVPADLLQPAVEHALLIAMSAAFGYCLGKPGLLGALGRTPAPAIDAAVRTTLADLVRDHVLRAADALAARAAPAQ